MRKAQIHSLFEKVGNWVNNVTWTVRGEEVTPLDANLCRYAYQVWMCMVIESISNIDKSISASRDAARHNKSFLAYSATSAMIGRLPKEVDVFEHINELSSASDFFRANDGDLRLPRGRYNDLHALLRYRFKLAHYYSQHVTTGKTIMIHGSPVTLAKRDWRKDGLSCLSNLTRLSLKDVDFSLESIKPFVETQTRLNSHVYPKFWIDEVKRVVAEWFKDFDEFHKSIPFSPKHGPGSIVEGTRTMPLSAKYDLLSWTHENLFYMQQRNADVPRFAEFDTNRHPKSIHAELVMVPKSYKTFRTISKETAGYQFLQQDMMYVLGQFTTKHKYLSKRIKLFDQSQNYHLARLGSLYHNHDTIDLSSASDSVSSDLVERIFPTGIREMLLSLRTDFVMLDGQQIQMETFGGMGNAVTFRLECIVFAAIVEASYRVYNRSNRKGSYYRTTFKTDFSIYGDDIICDPLITPTLIKALAALGFKVNTSKSFFGSSNFRESCGGEFINGVDVTPLRIPRGFKPVENAKQKHAHLYSSSGVYSSSIAYINTLYQEGYCYTSRWYLRQLLRKVPRKNWPIFSNEAGDFIFTYNQNEITDPSARLRLPIVRSQKRKSTYEGYGLLLDWLNLADRVSPFTKGIFPNKREVVDHKPAQQLRLVTTDEYYESESS